jgi:ubiquinone/menaquinone biosynthesis C-methylase UbiE
MNKIEVLKDSLEYFYLYNPGTALWRGIESVCFAELDLVHPVLDIGCSDGAFGALMMQLSKKRKHDKSDKIDIGIDIHFDRFSYPEAYKYFLKADATKLPFPDGYFNTVISNCVIEHIQGLTSALMETNRVIKSRGRFYFTVPSVYFNRYLLISSLFSKIGMRGIADRLIKRRNKKLAHYHILTVDDWQEVLLKSGLKLLYYKYIISKKMQRIVFFIFDIYNIGIGRFTIGNVIRKVDLMAYRFFQIRPVGLVFQRLFNSMFSKEFNGPPEAGGGLFIAAEKVKG